MKILLISSDKALINKVGNPEVIHDNNLVIFNKSNDSLDVMSFVLNTHPSLLILDDDYLKPLSGKILTSIKNVLPNIAIIFITSDDSHQLGREITPIGVSYYTLKPIRVEDLKALISSLFKTKSNQEVS
ncbi:MAG TPA: hypothetical protein VKA26_00865 [Ignavibacteriaceae bacterium]|nr:hypothetical protein [Ignavibacteriaceae bacterium]